MKAKLVYTSFTLIMLTFSALFGMTISADAKDVHALLILLGNDRKIRESVDVNREKLVKVFRQLSHHCQVHLTIMHSEDDTTGTVSRNTLANGRSTNTTRETQDIIESRLVTEWVADLTPAADDTVFVYYSGHGAIGHYDTHYLFFDDVNNDILSRGGLSRALKQKPGRLRMLITDTCSNRLSENVSDELFARYTVEVRAKARSYIEDLFLGHEGFLDITAASADQFAIAHKELGGHFTSALVSQGFTASADGDGDAFLSWDEAFGAAREGTMELYEKATFGVAMATELREKEQQTQEPVAHVMPKPNSLGGSAPPQHRVPTLSIVVLNFTSTPSGAKVVIDDLTVGKTPLIGYELEIGGQNRKNINVTVTATGYADAVERFPVQRGKPFDWEFELAKKVAELPKPLIGQDGAEMMLIPAGEFQMGSNSGNDDEKPVHTVYVDAFYMDEYEVTNAQYAVFLNQKGKHAESGKTWLDIGDGDERIEYVAGVYRVKAGYENHPVVEVSWYGAMAYAKWADKRLPTEAEWERAARGGLEGKKYPHGNTITPRDANYERNVGTTTAVGKYSANGYGLYDMAGNVWEWCLDKYDNGFYGRSPRENPVSGVNSMNWILDNYTNVEYSRVLRGGSWYNAEHYVRVANRGYYTPTGTYYGYGFRCARTVTP